MPKPTTPAASKHWHEPHLRPLCLPFFLSSFLVSVSAALPLIDVLSSLSSLDFFMQVSLLDLDLKLTWWCCLNLFASFQSLSNAKQQRLQPQTPTAKSFANIFQKPSCVGTTDDVALLQPWRRNHVDPLSEPRAVYESVGHGGAK